MYVECTIESKVIVIFNIIVIPTSPSPEPILTKLFVLTNLTTLAMPISSCNRNEGK